MLSERYKTLRRSSTSPVMRRLYELAESRGVRLRWDNLPGTIRGLYFFADGRHHIALDRSLRGRARSFVLAHELAHVCIPTNLPFTWPENQEEHDLLYAEEQKADEFARRLLFWVRRGAEQLS